MSHVNDERLHWFENGLLTDTDSRVKYYNPVLNLSSRTPYGFDSLLYCHKLLPVSLDKLILSTSLECAKDRGKYYVALKTPSLH